MINLTNFFSFLCKARVYILGTAFTVCHWLTITANAQDNCAKILADVVDDKPTQYFNFTPKVTPYEKPYELYSNRYCIKSYPWSDQIVNGYYKLPDGRTVDWHTVNPLQELTANQMRAIRERVNASLGNYKSSDLAKQGRLFGDYLYLRILEREGRNAEVLSEVARIRRQPYWNKNYLARLNIDDAEQATYFHPSSLQKFITLLEFDIQRRVGIVASTAHERKAVLNTIISVSENPNAFASASMLGIGSNPDMTGYATALSKLVEEVNLSASNDRMKVLKEYPDILGSVISDGYLDLYIGRKKMNLIRMDRQTGHVLLYAEGVAARTYRESCARMMRQFSSPDFGLVNVLHQGNRIKLQFADQLVGLTDTEILLIQQGKSLPEEHKLSVMLNSGKPLVVWSNPLMQRATGPLANVEKFCYGLQAGYPKASIIRDDFDPATTPEKTRQLSQYSPSKPDDLYVVVDANSGVDDGKLIANLRDDIQQAGIHIVDYKDGMVWQNGQKKGVIVITGHVDERLTAYVDKLGQAGFFRDNYVLLNSCNTPVSTQIVADINVKYGAIATHRFEGLILASRVEDFLADLTMSVKEPEQFTFERLVKKLATKAKLRGIWVICQLNRKEDYGSNF